MSELKLCSDCAHVAPEQQPDQGPYCGHPDAPKDPVKGNPTVRAHWMRQDTNADAGYPKCGTAGKLFQPKA